MCIRDKLKAVPFDLKIFIYFVCNNIVENGV